MKKTKYKIPRNLKNKSNFPFWYSIIYETENLINLKRINSIIDFGCGEGGFLQLLHFFHPHIKLTGVEKQKKIIDLCKKNQLSKKIKFIHYDTFAKIEKESQDLIFSQEVVYTIENLDSHANEIFEKLKKGGYYIFSIGCHIKNTTWKKRKERIKQEEAYNAYDYSPMDVARAFYAAGFRIAVKRLPIYYPLVFDFSPQNEFKLIDDLIISAEQHKLLFILLKPKYTTGEILI